MLNERPLAYLKILTVINIVFIAYSLPFRLAVTITIVLCIVINSNPVYTLTDEEFVVLLHYIYRQEILYVCIYSVTSDILRRSGLFDLILWHRNNYV